LATVRIYKVAELLDTTSQEVLALLKRDHGIELKSASSTIEEVVARSFVERLARQRNISLPGGDMFAEHPAPPKGGRKAAPAKKVEPPKPAAPVLGPPRLVKTIRPVVHTDDALAPQAASAVAEAPPTHAAPTAPPPADMRAEEPAPIEITEAQAEAYLREAPSAEPADASPPSGTVAIPDEAGASASPEPIEESGPPASGRFVPPTLRLRIEEPGQAPKPARPLAPAKRPQVSQPRIVQPPAAQTQKKRLRT
jgi:hypothetical protein